MQRKGRTLPLGETARLKLERPGNFSGRATRYVRPIPSPSLTLLPACMLPGDISAYCVRGGALVRLCASSFCFDDRYRVGP